MFSYKEDTVICNMVERWTHKEQTGKKENKMST